MTTYFLYGTMALPGVLDAVLGDGTAPEPRAAQVAGHAPGAARAVFALAVPSPGAGLDGVLLEGLGGAAAARLAFFAEAVGSRLTQVECRGLTALMPVWADAGEAAAGEMPEAEAMAPHAAREIMAYHGRRPGRQVAAMLPMILARAAARVAAQRGKPARLRSATPRDRVEVAHSDTPHAGFFLTRVQRLRHPDFAGGTSPLMTREVFVATDAAIVLPYDAARDRVLLVEQFRMGPFGRGDIRPWTLEPVAGRVDAGETPEATARRECEEEAGLVLNGLEHISSHYCSPGCSTEYFHIYLGLADLPDTAKGQGGLAAEHEDIRTHVIGFEAAMGLLQSGEADNGPLVLSLLWLAANRDRLRAAA